jgi:hypothetical protein
MHHEAADRGRYPFPPGILLGMVMSLSFFMMSL